MIELPVRQQKYRWSCTIDCACAAIEAMTGKYIETDDILNRVSFIEIAKENYGDLSTEMRKKAIVIEIPGNRVFYRGLSEAVRLASNEEVYMAEIESKLVACNGLGKEKNLKNPLFPGKGKFLNHIDDVMKEGVVVGATLDRANQHKIRADIPAYHHSVLIRDISKERQEVEILDVNYGKYGLQPFYWVPYSYIETDKFSIFRGPKSNPRIMRVGPSKKRKLLEYF